MVLTSNEFQPAYEEEKCFVCINLSKENCLKLKKNAGLEIIISKHKLCLNAIMQL